MATNHFLKSFLGTAPVASFERRQLYDEDFLESNCEQPFDPYTNIDNLDWTVYMSFIFFGATLLAGIAVWMISERKQADRYMASFFIMISLSYGLLPGVARMLVVKISGGVVATIPIRIGLVGFQVAHMLLMYVGIRSISGKLSARDLWLVINVLAIICALLNLARIVLLVSFIISLFMVCVFMFQAIKKDPKVWIKALAMILGVASSIISLVLAPRCGNEGYEKCFEDCPLPNAKVFSHNALQLGILTVSLLLLAFGEFLVPASSLFVDMVVGTRRQNRSSPSPARLEPVEEEDFDDKGSINP
jgi:hypothetical protein